MKLIILGPPGAGKGTQASILEKKLKIPHISTGEIFRENIKNNTKLGQQVKRYIENGELVPDEIVIEMTMNKLKEAINNNEGYILDGFPRTIRQAEALENQDITPQAVIMINLSEDECVNRLSSRRYCLHCGATYNIIYNPPKKDEICDICGHKLIQRDDDKEEVVRRRFKEYYTKTKPVIEYYTKKKKIINIDGHEEIREVAKNIEKRLKEIEENIGKESKEITQTKKL